jgi:starch phosphorylase
MTKERKQLRKESPDLSKRLHALARNLWWSWNPAAQMIFSELSPLTWEVSCHNPVAVLNEFSEQELRARFGDKDFLARLLPVLESFEHYMANSPKRTFKGEKISGPVAYFCAEFGLHECLPFYSGGLGVLAGDHTKSASDIRLPFVGIGLFYRQGYFQQRIDQAGFQQESFPPTDPRTIPVELVKDAHGEPLLCYVRIGSSRVFFQTWQITVGHSKVYLLDTDVPENEEHARGLTAMAYGGDVTTRIRQEIVLGIGGVRLLRALNIEPSVFHMNEGHSAFLTLELLREQMQAGSAKTAAEKAVRQKCVFTTHTPVAAGHDRFPRDLFEFTMQPYANAMGISMDELMAYGQLPDRRDNDTFTMTILALKFSRAANGVSEKHGEVSRAMWKDLFEAKSIKDVPIGYITNGVHVPSWTSRTSWEFWERHNSHKWKEYLHDAAFWKHVTDPKVVSDEELWSLRYELRRELIEFIRLRAREFRIQGGSTGEDGFRHLLNPDVLTLGFARRFAPYKRAPLIFHDLKRAEAIFNNPQRPVQIIFSGKAHPRDAEGKDFLHRIIELTRHPSFYGKVVFIENYDMNVARHLVSGCDVWLNNPRRPLEASGTSGQKVAINGGINASVLDGWWQEAYMGINGWAIGGKKTSANIEEEDHHDAESLYNTLEKQIIPLFYQRDKDGIPREWIKKMRNSMQTIVPQYNTHRMVMEYAEKYYFPHK